MTYHQGRASNGRRGTVTDNMTAAAMEIAQWPCGPGESAEVATLTAEEADAERARQVAAALQPFADLKKDSNEPSDYFSWFNPRQECSQCLLMMRLSNDPKTNSIIAFMPDTTPSAPADLKIRVGQAEFTIAMGLDMSDDAQAAWWNRLKAEADKALAGLAARKAAGHA